MLTNSIEMWIFLLLLISFVGEGLTIAASFYGDSYVTFPVEDASAETDIKLHFRTHRSDGLLLLAAGGTDYCVMELKNGMVRIRLDLGSGEASLSSPPGIRFDDLQWHHIHLMRSEAQVQLMIDGIYTTSATTPGQFLELNIDKGVYLGGLGDFTDVFFGNFKEYRGCLKDVLFNSVNIFERARSQVNSLNTYGISWDCSSEFGATSQQAISFVHNTSYIAFRHFEARNEGRISFTIKTRSNNALLFYNSGRLTNSDFLAIELTDGEVKLTVNKGSGAVELFSGIRIDDGVMHQVEVVIGVASYRISVDGERQDRTNFGNNRFLDLHGHLYVGGIGLTSRGQAIQKGLVTLMGSNAVGGSLIGCLQNIMINGKLMGFREAQVTRGLRPECVWSYPCLSNPCIEGAECYEEGFYQFKCLCDREQCVKFPVTEIAGSIPVNDMLMVRDLTVREGGRSVLTDRNIKVILDPSTYNIRHSSIMFKIANPPEYGQIFVDVNQRGQRSATAFTLLDLTAGKVNYVHDGSEFETDSVGLELEFKDLPDSAPQQLKETYGFTLIVKIAPWNDKPVIRLPAEDTLVLVENTQVKISSKILNVVDRDDVPSNLEYTIQYQQAYDIGYFEITDALGTRARITTFTQEDINESRVRYIHRGALRLQVRLQVSDGKDISDPKILKISAVPLRLSLFANTGMVLPPSATQLLYNNNLTFTSNTPNQEIDIRYEIIEPPYFGEIQKQQYSTNQWTTVTTFYQRNIDKSRLRYRHSIMTDEPEDYFTFKVHAMDASTAEYTFNIKYLRAEVRIVRNNELLMTGIKENRLTDQNLRSVSSIESHTPADIVYSITSTPQHGQLMRMEDASAGRPRKQRLSVGANFTQEDLNKGDVVYKLHKVLFEQILDGFQFRVIIPGDETLVDIFEIRYQPIDSDVTFVNNGLLNVIEGESKNITREDLYMETDKIKDFRYSVISGPDFGLIQLVDPITKLILISNATTFTNEDIRKGLVIYKHDDSESEEDLINFIATPILQQSEFIVQEISQFSGTFDIKIMLKNDNAPTRLVDKVFNVVATRGRIITLDDLKYEDPDVDFDSSQLIYTRRDIQNGEIVSTGNHSHSLLEFTQQDLAEGKVYFVHRGPNYGRSVIWVSDGQYYSTGLFEVQASEPYIKVLNNTGLGVIKGESVSISTANLSIETNLDAEDKDIKFIISDPPRYGMIKKNGQSKSRFNLADIKSGALNFKHDDSNSLRDEFSFMVKLEDLQVEADVKIKVMLDSHEDPPRITNNKVIALDERDTVMIGRGDLLVNHPETPAREIKYTITKHPQFGVLGIQDGPKGDELVYFSQADINNGKLIYRHKDMGAVSDTFMFDVTNGLHSLQGLEFVFEIVPRVIPIEVKDFSVTEGDSQLITNNIIMVLNRHFRTDPLVYVIIKQPISGMIENRKMPGQSTLQFSQEDLDEEVLYYGHDGSDTLMDEFTIMAKSTITNKQSHPQTIKISITPTNDQPPKIVINKRMQVWVASVTPLTSEYLKAEDKDSRPDELMYVISNPSNGFLALKGRPSDNIVNFTQALIDMEKVVFVHTGNDRGDFQFQVRDGLNTDKRRKFEIVAKPLQLNIQKYRELEVYPGIIQPITRDHLTVNTNDVNQTRPITFELQSKSQKGRLVALSNDTIYEITTFTQADIDMGRVGYEHTAVIDSWLQTDSFAYDISTDYAASITFLTFEISISYENINEENKEQLIRVSDVAVEEGGQVTITRESLDVSMLKRRLIDSGLQEPEVNYVVTKLPEHGYLTIDGENATKDTRFLQQEINKGRVHYTHDHSDSMWDAFHFLVEIEISGGLSGQPQERRASRLTNIFNITVLPVNDQPFELLTQYPEIELVQGFIANITKTVLNTADPDTAPGGIVYQVINGPSNGYLVLKSDLDRPITTFTQKDINNNQLNFIHDGSMETGAFYFSVSDGRFKPFYKVFNIRVHPLTLEINQMSDIEVIQGHSSAVLSPTNFGVLTNGDRRKVIYNITAPPMYGKMFMNDHPVFQFSQKDADNGIVMYIQTDFSSSKDYFDFVLYDTQNVITGQRMNITVKANVKQRTPFFAPAGGAAVITLDALDASDLAAITGDNPIYMVKQPPKMGSLIKVYSVRKKREMSKKKKNRNKNNGQEMDIYMEPAYNFTHEDVKNGVIQYKADLNDVSSGDRRDGFSYILMAKNAQPAPGMLEVMVQPPMYVTPVVGGGGENGGGDNGGGEGSNGEIKSAYPTKPTIGNKEEPQDPQESVSRDHMMVIILVCCVTVFTIVLLVVCKCMKKKRKRKYAMQEKPKEDSKTPLAQSHTQPPNVVRSKDDPPPGILRKDSHSKKGANIPKINITQDMSESPACRPRSVPSSPHPQRKGLSMDEGSKSLPRQQRVKYAIAPQEPEPDDQGKNVPTCKVTPLYGEDGEETGYKTPGGTVVKHEQLAFDWENIDPELLQHCRTSNPVLHKNKYWV